MPAPGLHCLISTDPMRPVTQENLCLSTASFCVISSLGLPYQKFRRVISDFRTLCKHHFLQKTASRYLNAESQWNKYRYQLEVVPITKRMLCSICECPMEMADADGMGAAATSQHASGSSEASGYSKPSSIDTQVAIYFGKNYSDLKSDVNWRSKDTTKVPSSPERRVLRAIGA